MSSEYFRSTEQTEAHDASVIVYWGEPFERPSYLAGVGERRDRRDS